MRRALTCLAIILAQPALALSCLPADIARDFNRAAQSDDSYIVVRGDLFFDETELPGHMDLDATAQREGREIAGWLKGKSLTRDGFTKTFERDVVLRVSCIGPWCGGAAKGPYLTFLRQEGRRGPAEEIAVTAAVAVLPHQAAGIRRSTISAHQEQPAGIASSLKLYCGVWTLGPSPLPTRI